jgi:hypothetical protein
MSCIQKITAYVPSASVKDILVQPDVDGKRGRWIAKILEFDLEIKPTKLVKGQGLAKLLAESNCEALGVSFINTRQDLSKLSRPANALKMAYRWQNVPGIVTFCIFCRS